MSNTTDLFGHIPIDPLTGAISVPIYQTATFVQEAPGEHKGFDYSRSNNPTRQALEQLIARLENGSTGLAFASGLAAIDTVLKLLKAGDEIVAVDDIYGGAYRLFTHVYEKLGIKIRYVDTTNAENIRKAVSPATRLIWIESPTNPTLKVSDIRAIAEIAKANDSLLCVDNTFATPVLQNPLDVGADIVIHSATKYLGGHSDLIAGLLAIKNPELGAQLKFLQNAGGNILGPFDSWLVIRGIETLFLRVQKHCENALKIARFLEAHSEVDQVYYPGLESHPNHAVASRQFKDGFGGIITFRLKADKETAAVKFLRHTKLFHLAESLGGVKSLCCHPASMTHKSVPVEKRLQSGITDGLIRLSVGLEEPEALIRDLDAAFAAIKQVAVSSVEPELAGSLS